MKKPGCIISVLMAIGILGFVAFAVKLAVTPRNLSREDPREVFEQFIVSPVPASVYDVKVNGGIAFAGSSISIQFKLDPSELDGLLEKGRFQPADSSASDWVQEHRPEGEEGELGRYMRKNENGLRYTGLIISADRKRAWFWEWSG